MFQIDFPEFDLRLKQEDAKQLVFDVVRKKFVPFTQEEMVRQAIIHHLNLDLGYPLSLLAVEKEILVDGMKKRCDIVAFNRAGKPTLLIECKAPEVKLTQTVLDQISTYNHRFRVPFLLISNGRKSAGFKFDEEKNDWIEYDAIPYYRLSRVAV